MDKFQAFTCFNLFKFSLQGVTKELAIYDF